MIRVLVVDDSAIVRKVLCEELSRLPDIEVVGTAVDPYSARQKIFELRPDVLTLDIQMPRMDGLSFLAKLMEHHPIPVVVVSSLATENSDIALRALELGAVDAIPKPGSQFSVPDVRRRLADAIRAAATARVGATVRAHAQARAHDQKGAAEQSPPATGRLDPARILAIGASAGGTVAIEALLRRLPADTPGTIIVQHMPPGFTRHFAERLDGVCRMKVAEAFDSAPLEPGRAWIAPGGYHTLVRRENGRLIVAVKDGPPVNRHKPSVDVLFHSVARSAGDMAVGVVLSGMGSDGAKGLLAMKEAGARTFAQDEQSSVVYGMPKAAAEIGAVSSIASLDAMPGFVLAALSNRR